MSASAHCLFFADIFVPDRGILHDIALEQLAALVIVKVNDLDAVFAQPVHAATKGAALAHHYRADAKLAHQAAALPARGQRGAPHKVTVAALAAGAAKGIGFRVDAGIAVLHAAIVAAAQQLALARKQRRTDGNAPLVEALASFFDGNCKHLFV